MARSTRTARPSTRPRAWFEEGGSRYDSMQKVRYFEVSEDGRRASRWRTGSRRRTT